MVSNTLCGAFATNFVGGEQKFLQAGTQRNSSEECYCARLLYCAVAQIELEENNESRKFAWKRTGGGGVCAAAVYLGQARRCGRCSNRSRHH